MSGLLSVCEYVCFSAWFFKLFPCLKESLQQEQEQHRSGHEIQLNCQICVQLRECGHASFLHNLAGHNDEFSDVFPICKSLKQKLANL